MPDQQTVAVRTETHRAHWHGCGGLRPRFGHDDARAGGDGKIAIAQRGEQPRGGERILRILPQHRREPRQAFISASGIEGLAGLLHLYPQQIRIRQRERILRALLAGFRPHLLVLGAIALTGDVHHEPHRQRGDQRPGRGGSGEDTLVPPDEQRGLFEERGILRARGKAGLVCRDVRLQFGDAAVAIFGAQRHRLAHHRGEGAGDDPGSARAPRVVSGAPAGEPATTAAGRGARHGTRGACAPQRLDLAARDLFHDGHRIGTGDGWAQGEDVVEDCPERVDVRAGVERLHFAARLLGGHLLRRAHDRAVERAAGDARVAPHGEHHRARGGHCLVGVHTSRRREHAGACPSDHFREAPVHDQHLAEAPEQPTWIFCPGQSRVESVTGLPLTKVPLLEPRSSISA